MLPTDYQNIGHYLRDSRESLKISLEDAARILHIRARYLEALERGDLSDMPGKAYIRGYVRTYAEYLRLDTGALLDAYVLAIGPKAQDLFIPEPTLQQNMPTRLLIWLSCACLVLLYVVWYYGFHDRQTAEITVKEIPRDFAHSLDKTSSYAMDRPWENCLNGNNVGCYIILRSQTLSSYLSNASLYDPSDYITPSEP